METRANYILIGTFTLIASIGLMLFALWAANYSSEREWRAYRVIFHEPVTGLSEGSSVLYNGLAVGTVRQLMLDPNDPRAVIAELRLHASAPVKTDTSARLSMTSLTGAPVIQLTGGSPEAPMLVARGNTVPVIETGASALQNIADTANRLVERLDRALSEDNVAHISHTLSYLEQITRSMTEREDDIHALFTNQLDCTAHPSYHTLRGLRVSSHFVILRSGVLWQYVDCELRAWHAGISHYRGRNACNDDSIGIELEGLEGDRFTAAQYATLLPLCRTLMQRWPIRYIAGHQHIAPGRKGDPGAGFDWHHLRRALAGSGVVFPFIQ